MSKVKKNANNICNIVGSGDFKFKKIDLNKNDIIIAADGGFDILEKINIKPNYLVGDMDSIKKIPNIDNIKKYPKEKDDTDMTIAIEMGIELGYKNFILYGAYGDRPDHFYSNLQSLTRYCLSGFNISLKTIAFTVYPLINGILKLNNYSINKTVSIFSTINESKNICIKDLYYKLDNAILNNTIPLGVSNKTIGKPFEISVEQGSLLIFVYN